MPSPELRVSVDVIRRAAQLACEAASFRVVAAEAGMSAMGMRAFVRGDTTPQPRTVRKVSAWYARHMARRPSEGEAEARAALSVLAGFLSPDRRSRLEARFLEVMDDEFRASGMAPPAWFETLRSEVRDRAD
jgi:hypothetical protein